MFSYPVALLGEGGGPSLSQHNQEGGDRHLTNMLTRVDAVAAFIDKNSKFTARMIAMIEHS